MVHSEDGRAACGEPPHSPYACGMYGGLWQHGEAHNILFSDEHASVTNEVRAGWQQFGRCGSSWRVCREQQWAARAWKCKGLSQLERA